MFARFTDRARKAMALANQEAQRLNHEYLGTEHILLGLVREGSGLGATVLKNLGADLPTLRAEVDKLVQGGPDTVVMGKLPQTPRAKTVIEFAIQEAGDLGHDYVGTEHILLGLLRESDGIAAQVLMNLGLKLEAVRQEVLNLLGVGEEQGPVPSFIGTCPDEKKPREVNYRDLPVWQKADALVQQVYTVTGTFPREEISGVASRLREIALTIPPHVAAASDRQTSGESKWFLNAALGSLRELRYLLDFSKNLKHLKDQDHQMLADLADEVSKLLREFHASLLR